MVGVAPPGYSESVAAGGLDRRSAAWPTRRAAAAATCWCSAASATARAWQRHAAASTANWRRADDPRSSRGPTTPSRRASSTRSSPRGRQPRLVGAARRHRAAAAHRLHQRREPAAGPCRGARARPGGAGVARRQPRPARSARSWARPIALGLLGSAAGLGLAWALLRAFVATAPANFPRLAAIGLTGRCCLRGRPPPSSPDWWPDWRRPCTCCAPTSTPWSAPAPAAAPRPDAPVRRAGCWWSVEVALALALLTTAGLLTKSLLRLQDQDLGMTRAPVLTFSVGLPPVRRRRRRRHRPAADRVPRSVRTVPGVTQASAIDMLPVAATGTTARCAGRSDSASATASGDRGASGDGRLLPTMGLTLSGRTCASTPAIGRRHRRWSSSTTTLAGPAVAGSAAGGGHRRAGDAPRGPRRRRGTADGGRRGGRGTIATARHATGSGGATRRSRSSRSRR